MYSRVTARSIAFCSRVVWQTCGSLVFSLILRGDPTEKRVLPRPHRRGRPRVAAGRISVERSHLVFRPGLYIGDGLPALASKAAPPSSVASRGVAHSAAQDVARCRLGDSAATFVPGVRASGEDFPGGTVWELLRDRSQGGQVLPQKCIRRLVTLRPVQN